MADAHAEDGKIEKNSSQPPPKTQKNLSFYCIFIAGQNRYPKLRGGTFIPLSLLVLVALHRPSRPFWNWNAPPKNLSQKIN